MNVFGVLVLANPLLSLFFLVGALLYISLRMGFKRLIDWRAAIIVVGVSLFSLLLHDLGQALVITSFGGEVLERGAFWWGTYIRFEAPVTIMLPLMTFAVSVAAGLINLWLVSVLVPARVTQAS